MRCPACFTEGFDSHHCRICGFIKAEARVSGCLSIGTQLRNVECIIGSVLENPGVSGITYLAWDQRKQKKVLIREYLPFPMAARTADGGCAFLTSPEHRQLFELHLQDIQSQAERAMQLQHPGIAPITDCFCANNTLYLAADYFEAETLPAYLAQAGKAIGPTALELVGPILGGLAAAHGMKLLHLNIHPENIYLDPEGKAVLHGFDFVRLFFANDRQQSRVMMVQPGFSAAEQYCGISRQGPWTDVYSIAAILYWMLTGQAPPDGVERMIEDRLVPISELAPELDNVMSTAIMQGMAIRREERPQSIIEFTQALTAARPATPNDAPGSRFQETTMSRYLRLSVEAAEREQNAAVNKGLAFGEISRTTWLVLAMILTLLAGSVIFFPSP